MRHLRSRRCLAAILGLGLAAASVAPAAAQSGAATRPADPASPGAVQQQSQYSDDDLKAFAVAALEVRQIREDYTPKVQSADSPEKRQTISREATDRMVEAVEKHGLTAEKYNNIYAASQSDPTLAERVNQHLRDAQ